MSYLDKPHVLDLFCGTGGFSLGAHKAGASTSLAIDIDPILTSSFSKNFPSSKLVLADISQVTAEAIRREAAAAIDGVIGGAPCQAFSEIGRNDVRDPRRQLVGHFFRVVAELDPTFFIFENVRGLLNEKNVVELNNGLSKLPSHWEVIGPIVLDASEFGAPTKRKRTFVFGFNTKTSRVPKIESLVARHTEAPTVREAIGDLVGAKESGSGNWRYDMRRKVSPYANRMRTASGGFSGHNRTTHSSTTLERFSKLKPGSVDPIGRYPRLAWDGLCPTLRAGTGSDHGSHQAVRPVHPEENRVITPREAARLQGFPDEFVFHPTIWHSFRMIGNSVSPILAEKVVNWAMSAPKVA